MPISLGRKLVAMGEFVEHPRLAQRVGALHQMLVEDAELAGIEAVEARTAATWLSAIGPSESFWDMAHLYTCHCQLVI